MRGDRLRLLDAIEQLDIIRVFSARGKEAFLTDLMVQSAILHRLTLLGEACRALSDTLRADHPEIPWPQIIAFRNVLIHQYFGMHPDLVWTILEAHVPPLESALRLILESLPE